ncbi:MAG: flagellar basal body rod protein FlgB [Candidatus Zixiibacteriota bacterium]|nr:flagellar basal body rod protein FlgB [candidate division Zixibacteria bacterium]MBU1471479.1 flagellar basal body rod protein FlgB [candidate division Zixibacteria bacterium]
MSNIINKAIIQKTSIPVLKRMLDLSSLRHKLIASNVANVTTPGYKSKSIDFDAELRKALKPEHMKVTTTHPGHIPLRSSKASPPKVKVAEETDESNGVNSVDIDREMGDLAQNQLVYELAAKLAGNKFKALKSAIRGRPL